MIEDVDDLIVGRMDRMMAATKNFLQFYREQPEKAVRFIKQAANEARYLDVLGLAEQIPPNARGATRWKVPMLTGHARLALQVNRTAQIEQAIERESGGCWLVAETLMTAIRGAVQGQRPFSAVRLGDGEARFLVHMHKSLQSNLSVDEVDAIGDVIWINWFGAYAKCADAKLKMRLLFALEEAVSEADVVGLPNSARLRIDNAFIGYLAAQEKWLKNLPASKESRYFTDAFAHYYLHQLSPFLAELLIGLDFLGVISPHNDAAKRLQKRFGIGAIASHTLAGEYCLTIHRGPRTLDPTLPDAHDRILRELLPPRQGALYLVAGGLLGKIYCGHIRRLGGVAIDVGSLIDGWMGFNTRPGHMDNIDVLETA